MIFMDRKEIASWKPESNSLCHASAGAWRYLRAACFDTDGRLVSLEPYETYYPT